MNKERIEVTSEWFETHVETTLRCQSCGEQEVHVVVSSLTLAECHNCGAEVEVEFVEVD
jgi:transcription elongation factor Elf1